MIGTFTTNPEGYHNNILLDMDDFIDIIQCLDRAADALLITTRTTQSKYETEPGKLALYLVQKLGYASIGLSNSD